MSRDESTKIASDGLRYQSKEGGSPMVMAFELVGTRNEQTSFFYDFKKKWVVDRLV